MDIFPAIWPAISILLSGVIGYFIGSVKSFRDEKQKAYGEILPYLKNGERRSVGSDIRVALK